MNILATELGKDFYIATGSLLTVIVLGLWLTVENYKRIIAEKPERIKARRAYKRKKNIALAKALGIDYNPKDDNEKDSRS